MSFDVLALTYTSHGRDVDIYEPILSYLEIKYGLNVQRGCGRDYYKLIMDGKPKVVMVSPRGSAQGVNAVRFAKCLGIAVVGVECEGIYLDSVKNYYWQVDKPEYNKPDLYLLWSSASEKKLESAFPGIVKKHNMHVVGGCGFDRYKFMCLMGKDEFLSKYKMNRYKKVVGFAGFGFVLSVIENLNKYQEDNNMQLSDFQMPFHVEATKVLNQILRELIKKNKDVLFLLKFHPSAEISPEFDGLQENENVLAFDREENIADLINVCDLWMGYETTSAVEAWMLGKTTVLINPLGWKGVRRDFSNGSPIYKSTDEVQHALDEFYSTGKICDFEDLNNKRRNIIKDVMEYDDGMNHIRAGELVYDLFKSYKSTPVQDGFNVRRNYLIRSFKKMLFDLPLKKFKFYRKLFPMFSMWEKLYNDSDREWQHAMFFCSLRKFYKENNIVS